MPDEWQVHDDDDDAHIGFMIPTLVLKVGTEVEWYRSGRTISV